MSRPARILVCFALEREAAPFRRLPDTAAGGLNTPGARAQILVTGMGPEAAAQAVERRLDGATPGLVLTCGFAGALAPGLRCADVIHETTDRRLAASLGAAGSRQGRFHCDSTIAVTAAGKARLHRETGADAVEMESGAIQRVCAARGIPCATVRAVSDDASGDLPLDFNRLRGADGQLSGFRLAVAILARPGSIPGLIRLGRNSAAASQNLARVLSALIVPD